jgi:hypothetical protein
MRHASLEVWKLYVSFYRKVRKSIGHLSLAGIKPLCKWPCGAITLGL